MAKKAPAVEPEVAPKPAKSQQAPKAEAPSKPAPTASRWQELLDDIGAESNDPRLYYIKNGRNRLRLVPENNDPEKFFVRVTRTYQGRTSTKFLLRAIPMGKEDHAVKGVPVGKACLKGILNLLAEGYDLLSPKNGLGITIVKSGSGQYDTSYMALPSPTAVPLPKNFTDLDISLAELAEEIAVSDRERDDQRDERPKPTNRRGAAALGRKQKAYDEDEDTDAGW